MEDVDVSLWLDQGAALYLATLAVAIGQVNFYRTFRMFKVDKRTRIAVEALIAHNQLSRLDATLKQHAQEWSELALLAVSDAIGAECESVLHDIRRITDRNGKLRELLDAVEHSLDSIPAVLVSYSLLDKTHREFLNLWLADLRAAAAGSSRLLRQGARGPSRDDAHRRLSEARQRISPCGGAFTQICNINHPDG